MKTNSASTRKITVLMPCALAAVLSAWLGCKPAPVANQQWTPKIGDRVQTHFNAESPWDGKGLQGLNGRGGPVRIVTLTNVVHVGERSQTGILVYGDGLPGVDSWWVTPAP